MIMEIEASFHKPVTDARKYVPVFCDLILRAWSTIILAECEDSI